MKNVIENILADLGVDRNTMVMSPERIENLHYIKFTLDGCGYTAYFTNFANRIDIKCNDLEFKDGEIADQRLYDLSKKINNPDGNIVMKIVVWPEGDMPELMILYE